MELDRNWQFMHMDCNENQSSRNLPHVANELHNKCETIEGEDDGELEIVWDDAFGATLDPPSVGKARGEELQYVRKMGLYKKVSIVQCYNKTGKAPNQSGGLILTKGIQKITITGQGLWPERSTRKSVMICSRPRLLSKH